MIVFVTGATSGYGRATAQAFIRSGAKVVGTGRRENRLQELKKDWGENFLPLNFDVSKRTEVESAIQSLPEGFREVDVLVNNAGGAIGLDPAPTADLDDWDAMVDINVKGVIYCTRLLLPGMVERKRGHIINLGSVAAEFPYPGGNVYGAVKAFVHQFSYNLRSDLVGTGVRVTDIQPGLTSDTEFSKVRFKGDEEKAAAVYKGVKALSADDVAETIHWVATRPQHVNINVVQLMATAQAWGPFAIHRQS